MSLLNRSMSYHVGNIQGVGARARQEDSFTFVNAFDVRAIRDNGLLFVVCDGMGGMKDGKAASEAAIACLRNAFIHMDRNVDITAYLKSAVFQATREVEALLDGQGGSTVVAGIIYRESLYYVSVGDSFFYLKRGNSLYRINREHNMCNQVYLDCIREGVIDSTEGRSHPESAALTQFLGMTGMDDVDGFVRPMPVKEGDVFLACSDGVGGTLDENEVLEALSLSDPQRMCERIEQGIFAHNKRNQDNYTALVVKCIK